MRSYTAEFYVTEFDDGFRGFIREEGASQLRTSHITHYSDDTKQNITGVFDTKELLTEYAIRQAKDEGFLELVEVSHVPIWVADNA